MYGITGFVDNTHTLNETHLREATQTANVSGHKITSLFITNNDFHAGFIQNQASADRPKVHNNAPVSSSCGLYTVVLHGAIYNDVELRETLIKYGVIFKTLTDSEVLLECYKKWGHKVFDKIEGAYTFALLDRRQNQLVIARDPMGSKPLFYFQQKGFYAFATEIKSLLKLPNIEKKLNTAAIATYFRYGYFGGTETIYGNIRPFQKGTLTVIDLHSGNLYNAPVFVTPDKKKEIPSVVEHEVIERTEELLTEAILKKYTANTSAGIVLTGGYNSAVAAALLQKNTSKRMKTFAIAFEKSAFNRAPQTKKIAEHLKTSHKEYDFHEKDAVQLLERLPAVFEEPVGDSTALVSLFTAQQLKGEIDVVLGTESADILFGGYPAYHKVIQLHNLPNRIPRFLKNTFHTLLRFASPKIQEVINADHLLTGYQHFKACFTAAELERLLAAPSFYTPRVKAGEKTLEDLVYYDMEHYLPDNLLYQHDKCYMHAGIENKDAFLKDELTAYLSKLNTSWFLHRRETKPLLRKIAQRHLPDSLLHEREDDYRLPLSSWLKGIFKPYIETYLSPYQLNRHQLFNPEEVQRIKTAFYRHGNLANSQKIWLLLMFQLWYDKWMS